MCTVALAFLSWHLMVNFMFRVVIVMVVLYSKAKGELNDPSVTLRVAVCFKEVVRDGLVEAIVGPERSDELTTIVGRNKCRTIHVKLNDVQLLEVDHF